MHILIIGILFLIFISIYADQPKYVQVILFIANMFLPDPIPYVDEIIMLAVMFKSWCLIKNHPWLIKAKGDFLV